MDADLWTCSASGVVETSVGGLLYDTETYRAQDRISHYLPCHIYSYSAH